MEFEILMSIIETLSPYFVSMTIILLVDNEPDITLVFKIGLEDHDLQLTYLRILN